ncbi:MAG: hypothetical protein R3B55_03840 [Candidatus Paceibacterota bacterium]
MTEGKPLRPKRLSIDEIKVDVSISQKATKQKSSYLCCERRIPDKASKWSKLTRDNGKSATFWGSARLKEDHEDYQRAWRLSKRISGELGYSIVTGGGPGIMEAGNRGAYEMGKPS